MPRMEDLLAEGQGLIEVGGTIVAADLVTNAEFTAANIVAEFTGTPDGTKYLRDDGTLAAAGGSTARSDVKAYRSTALTLPNATTTVIAWDAEEWDNGGFHDNITNPSRLTVPASLGGLYEVVAGVGVSGTSYTAGRWITFVRKNGADVRGGTDERVTTTTASPPSVGLTVHLDLVAGDYVEVGVYQTSGSDQALELGRSALSMRKVS